MEPDNGEPKEEQGEEKIAGECPKCEGDLIAMPGSTKLNAGIAVTKNRLTLINFRNGR